MSPVTNGTRAVHLVGTIPAPDTAAALALVAETLGDTLPPWLPDGETGNRQDWINRIVEGLRTHPDLELASDGDWSSYDDTPGFKVRKGHTFESVDLDYVAAFEQSWPVFQRFRQDHGSDFTFQVGIPGHLDIGLIAFGFKLRRALRNLGPFRDASVEAITTIHQRAGDAVVFQLEVPIELILLTRLPGPVRGIATRRLSKEVLRVVEASPAGTRFGLHLCYGDLNHESLGKPKDAGPLVRFANELIRRWPTDRPLEFLHAPFALAKEPPPVAGPHYEPLAGLNLPPGVRFAGGFIHEGRSDDELAGIRDQIESLLGTRIDIAASCGLGRRDAAAARRNLERSKAIALR
jgi:hypothetical protein